MAPTRTAPLARPVRLEVDGARVLAREGEPIAVALAAAGRLVLARSVKYHRPRGPTCFSGRCDGCLMRVDGVPSVMTCRVPAVDGLVIETQNVLGSARRDLLAATDWFFPDGMNHHEMFTWSESVNKVMQKIARRIAGIGELPTRARTGPPPEVARERVDVLVIGGGPAGLAAATEAGERGLEVLLVDEEPRPGGHLRWWPGPIEWQGKLHEGPRLADALLAAAEARGVRCLTRTSVIAAFDPWEAEGGANAAPITRPRQTAPVLIADGAERLTHITAREVVIATGRHEGASAFEGADTPGVLQLRGACELLAHGVRVGARVVLAGAHPALAPLGARLREVGAEVLGPYPEAALRAARGRPEVDAVVIAQGGGEEELECDAIVIAPPTSAVYELAAQLGVPLRFTGEAFELGAPPPDVRVVGWAQEGPT